MSYIGAPLVSTNFVLDQFTATDGQTVFTMTRAPASNQSVLVGIDGVVQEPGVAYTVSGTTMTLTSGAPLNSKVWVLHLGVRGTANAPADGSVVEASFDSDFLANTGWRKELFTAKALTSGTTSDFTDIPSWARRITVMVSGMSTNGTSVPLIQLGDAGGIEATGYLGAAGNVVGSVASNYTTGFGFTQAWANTLVVHGMIELALLDSAAFQWVCRGSLTRSDGAECHVVGGSKSLSATLDRVRLTMVNGTDAFDAGSWNILVEG